MRDIIFRAKTIIDSEWVVGFYLHQTEYYGDDCNNHYIIDGDDHNSLDDKCEQYEIDPNTLAQFVGLLDKNGKRIFEGDIVKSKVHTHLGYRIKKGIVEYYIDGFKIKVDNEYKNIPFESVEIIGNIHDKD